MAKVAATMDLSTMTVTAMADWYRTHDVPEAFRKIHPDVLKVAKRISGGVWGRCATDDGASIIVYNYAVW